MLIGTINAVDQTNGVTIQIDGEEEATTKKYTYLSSYSPTVNDRVLVEEVGDSYVIIGKVTDDYATSGRAHYADTAGTAASATSAASATTATSATSATKATQDESGNNIKNTYGASLYFSSGTLYLRNKNSSNISNVTITASKADKADGVTNTASTGQTIYFRVNGSTFSAATSKNGPWYNLN